MDCIRRLNRLDSKHGPGSGPALLNARIAPYWRIQSPKSHDPSHDFALSSMMLRFRVSSRVPCIFTRFLLWSSFGLSPGSRIATALGTLPG